MPDPSPIRLSLLVATAATILVFPIGTLVGWILARRQFRGKSIVETVITLPLVLPPTVIGFALLEIFGRGTSWGRWLNDLLHIHLLFTPTGATIAAAIMASPLFVRTSMAAFSTVDDELLDAARLCGATEVALFRRIALPLAYPGIIAATILAFARALGEFGATLMVAGNIPGVTQTLPLALYDRVQAGKTGEAFVYTLILIALTFLFLIVIRLFERQLAIGWRRR